MLGLCPTGSRTEKARTFIDAFFRMNRALGIPERVPCILPEDLPQMAAWAEAEANPVYPVPAIFSTYSRPRCSAFAKSSALTQSGSTTTCV